MLEKNGRPQESFKPLPITGLGVLSAAGRDLTETKASFFNSCDFSPPAILNENEVHYYKLNLQDSWRREFDLPRAYAPNLLALAVIEEALRSARLNREDLKNCRVGVCLGSTVGATNFDEEFNRAFFMNESPSSDVLWNYFKSNTAQFVSRYYGLRGPVSMLNNACASGADAIGTAAAWLESDVCDLVICGGIELIYEKIYRGFKSLLLCSPDSCRPFDRDRQGLVLGEGGGIFVLEKPGSPRAPHAFFLGAGQGSDAYHPTSPHPEARGLNLAVSMALEQAGVALAKVDFINAHGTATPTNDLTEGRWIARHCPQAQLVATKGYTGHTLGAAGAVEAVFTALSLLEQKLPVTRGFSTTDPEIGIAPTREITSGHFQTALSLSLGFGGANSALCLGVAK